MGWKTDISPERPWEYAGAFLEWHRFAWMAISPPGAILFWSPGAEELFGYRAAEAEGRLFFDMIVPPGRIQEARDATAGALRTGHASIESVRRRKDGSLIFVDIAMKSVADREGKPSFIIVSQRDITRRKQTEGELRASEERYRRIVETATEGIWTIDFDGTTAYINQRGAAILGYTPEEMIGRSPRDFEFPEVLLTGGSGTGVRHLGGATEADYRVRRKGAGEVFLHVVTAPILGERGEYRGALLVFTDITDKKRSDETLRRLSSIVEHSNEAIISETLEGVVTSWNAAATRIFGYTAHEVLGKHISLLVPPERDDDVGKILTRIRKGETVDQYTTIRCRKDGQRIDVSETVSLIRDASNAITGASIIVRDITEEKRLREELDAVARRRSEDLRKFALSIQRAQEEERQRISRELHDDLGQRLTGLKLKIEVLGEDLPADGGTLGKGLEEVRKGIEALVSEVRRISSNLRPAVLDDFGLVAAMRLLCKEFEASSRIAVRFRGEDVRCADKNAEIALYRIAQEALSNVARHAGARTVAVRLGRYDGTVRLVVEDDGRGLDSTRREGERRGLGLVGMNERAQLLGGKVSINSSPGSGTRLQVDIPAHEEGVDEKD